VLNLSAGAAGLTNHLAAAAAAATASSMELEPDDYVALGLQSLLDDIDDDTAASYPTWQRPGPAAHAQVRAVHIGRAGVCICAAEPQAACCCLPLLAQHKLIHLARPNSSCSNQHLGITAAALVSDDGLLLLPAFSTSTPTAGLSATS
jgi:hypothetical protein